MTTSLLAWTILAWVHIVPWLSKRSKREALLFAVIPHMFRHIGAMAIFPGVADVPREWSIPLAYGDGITALLAMFSMIALKRSSPHATKVVWVFNVFGFLDLLHNARNAIVFQVAPRLGVIAYVVGFVVPLMLVCHVLIFWILQRKPASDGRRICRHCERRKLCGADV